MIVISQLDEVTVQLDLETLLEVTNFVDKLLANPNSQHLVTNFVDNPNKIRAKMIMGFTGEKAVAEYLDAPHVLQQGLLRGHGQTDVDGIEVRSVEQMGHCLITNSKDKPAPYVLAVVDVHVATVVLRGWANLQDCHKPEFWRTDVPRPAYFTPATALHPMDTLRTQYQNRKRR